MGIDTKIILIPCIVTEFLTKERFLGNGSLNVHIGGIAQG